MKMPLLPVGMLSAMNGEMAMTNDFLSRLASGKLDKDILAVSGRSVSALIAITAVVAPFLYWDWNYSVKERLEFCELLHKPSTKSRSTGSTVNLSSIAEMAHISCFPASG